MKILDGTADLLAVVGTELGTSEWLPMDQSRVDTFADATGDHQWIHVDPARARSGPFGATIAHGYLTLSLVPVFMHDVLEIRGFSMAVNYGLNKVRFPQPVTVGSSIRGVVSVVQANDAGSHVDVVYRVAIEVDGAAKPACVAETVVRYVL